MDCNPIAIAGEKVAEGRMSGMQQRCDSRSHRK
jgi:hypothetical protein